MSYNAYRRTFRLQMRDMIEEFKKEAGLSARELDNVLNAKSGEKRVTCLKDRFNKMINLSLGKYNKPDEVVEETQSIEEV